MEIRLSAKIEQIKQPKYSDMANNLKAIERKQQESSRLAKAILNQTKPPDSPEELEKQARTCIVRKPNDPNIRNSHDIREAMRKKYGREICIKHTRNTVGGSILLEFVDVDTAEEIIETWDKNLFGGNEGIGKLQPRHTAAIIKQVSRQDEDITKNEIEGQFPGARIEFFKKGTKFIGTIKIIFKDEESLKAAIETKCRIDNQIYALEVFIPKRRVIKCNFCQKFGHISRRCWNQDKPVCAKCGNNHETKDCTVDEQDYKCVHCSGNHIAGSFACEKVKEKMEQIESRNNNG